MAQPDISDTANSGFPRPARALVIGARGAIGAAMAQALAAQGWQVTALARHAANGLPGLDITDEASVACAAEALAETAPFHLIFNATGLLHKADHGVQPEKAIRQISAAAMAEVLAVNAIGPALICKYFVPLLARQEKAVMAHLSARVGSISDNRLGGWTSYRAAKAAQNMIVKNTALEIARKHKHMVIVGLHPGTVDSPLSLPFQSAVSQDKLFTPAQSAAYLVAVIERLTPEDSGHVLAWDGQNVPA